MVQWPKPISNQEEGPGEEEVPEEDFEEMDFDDEDISDEGPEISSSLDDAL